VHTLPGLQTDAPLFHQTLVFILWNGNSLQPKNDHGQQSTFFEKQKQNKK